MPISVRSASSAGASTQTISVAKPSPLTVGDQLWAIHINDGGTAGTSAPGWTASATNPGSLFTVRVWRKTVTASEPDTYTFNQDNDADGTVHIIAVAGADLTGTAHLIVQRTSLSETAQTPDVTPAGVPSVEIRVAAVDDQNITWQTPSGYTSRGSAHDEIGFISSTAATRTLNSSSSAGPQTFTPSPDSFRASIGVSLSIPAAAVPEPEIPSFPPFTPARGTALYSYRFRRLRDGQFLGFLDLADVSFDKRINQAGTFSATIPIPSREVGDIVAEVFPRDSSVLSAGSGVVVVDILRGGDIWGEYWITSHKPSRSRRGTPAISIQGTTLDGYMSAVELQTASGLVFEQTDQIDILRGLIADMQGQPYANIGLAVASGTSGVLRDRTYADDGGTYGQRIRELAEVDNGFEYTIDIGVAEGTVARQIRWGYPTLAGTTIAHTFSDGFNGGDIVEWGEEVDALRGATRWRARGGTPPSEGDASVTSVPLMSAVYEASTHLQWWPRIDRTLSYPDVIVQQTIEDYAAYWASVAPGALRVETYTVVLGANPSLHPNTIGDWARIYLDNEWHTPHWRTRRIIGLQITPVSRKDGKEYAKLVLEGLDVGGAPSIGGDG